MRGRSSRAAAASATASISARIAAVRSAAPSAGPTAAPISSMSLKTARCRGVDDEDRDAERAELGDRVGRVEAVAAGDDEVGLEADDLLDVDRVELRDVGQIDGFGRVVVEVLDLADRPGRRRRARTGSRSLAGVSETIFCGLGRDLDGRALVVGEGQREGGGRRRAGARQRRRGSSGGRSGHGRRRVRRPPPVQAARTATRVASRAARTRSRPDARGRRTGREWGTREPPGGMGADGGVRGNRDTPRFEASKEGCQPVDRTVLPTFLSKVRACTAGSATGLRTSGQGDHRSGTVPESHRLRDHAAY